MLHYITQVALEALGLRKKGLRGDNVELTDYQAQDYVKLGSTAAKKLPKQVHLMNTHTYNQGRTNTCTAHMGALMAVIMYINRYKDKSINFDAFEQWENQKEYPGTADDKLGDYLKSAFKALKRFGLRFNNKVYKIDGYAVVDKSQWREYLANGHPIGTGFSTGNPLCGSNWFWRLVKLFQGPGHAFVIVGYDDDKQAFIAQNSWGRWGWRKTSEFYIRYDDQRELFRGWVIYLPPQGEDVVAA